MSEAPSRRSKASLGRMQAGGVDAPLVPPHRLSASGSGTGVPDVRWWGSAGSSESAGPSQPGQQYGQQYGGGSGIPAPKPVSSSGGDSGGRVAAMAARLEEQLRSSLSSRPSYADPARAAAAAVRDAGKPSAKPASFSGTPSRIPTASPSLASSSSVPLVRGPVWVMCAATRGLWSLLWKGSLLCSGTSSLPLNHEPLHSLLSIQAPSLHSALLSIQTRTTASCSGIPSLTTPGGRSATHSASGE